MVLLSLRNVKLKEVLHDDEDEPKMTAISNIFEMYAFAFVLLWPAWIYLRISYPSHILPVQATLGKMSLTTLNNTYYF